MGIGTNTPDASSVLDISANDKGVLVPRLTTQQRLNIPNPADGLLVYDSDEQCFFFHQGVSATWSSLCNTGIPGPQGPPGTSGVQLFSLTGDSTYVSNLYPVFTPITGFDTTFILTDTATVCVFSTGNTQNLDNNSGTVQNALLQMYINGVAQPYTLEAAAVFVGNDARRWVWSVSKTFRLPAGSYHFQMKICKDNTGLPGGPAIIACPYYNLNTPSNPQNRHCNLTFQVFY